MKKAYEGHEFEYQRMVREGILSWDDRGIQRKRKGEIVNNTEKQLAEVLRQPWVPKGKKAIELGYLGRGTSFEEIERIFGAPNMIAVSAPYRDEKQLNISIQVYAIPLAPDPAEQSRLRKCPVPDCDELIGILHDRPAFWYAWIAR